MIRWLDFNDTWLAAEWGHPSDNLGGILAVADWQARKAARRGPRAADRARPAHGDDQGARDPGRHGARERLQPRRPRPRDPGAGRDDRGRRRACWAAREEQVVNAVSNAWIDGGALRTYRHAPNTGSRKSWAAGDATSRGVRHALIALRGRDGLSVGAHRAEVGLLRRAVPRQPVRLQAGLRQLRHGERAVQDQLPGRVPRPDRGRVRDAPASARSRTGSTRSNAS